MTAHALQPAFARQLEEFKAAEDLRRADEMPSQAEKIIALCQTVLDGIAQVSRHSVEFFWLSGAAGALFWLGFVTRVKRRAR